MVFERIRNAAELNVAFDFVLKNVEKGSCRYYYAQENSTAQHHSKLPLQKTSQKSKIR